MKTNPCSANKSLLAKQRQMTSLIDQEIIAEGETMTFAKIGRTALYFDLCNMVTSDCGRKRAFRGVTKKGQLIWLCFDALGTKAQMSFASDPFDAMDQMAPSTLPAKASTPDSHGFDFVAPQLLAARFNFDSVQAGLFPRFFQAILARLNRAIFQ